VNSERPIVPQADLPYPPPMTRFVKRRKTGQALDTKRVDTMLAL
jgi:hypothetical protein